MWRGGPACVGGCVGMCVELGMCGWMWGGYVGGGHVGELWAGGNWDRTYACWARSLQIFEKDKTIIFDQNEKGGISVMTAITKYLCVLFLLGP